MLSADKKTPNIVEKIVTNVAMNVSASIKNITYVENLLNWCQIFFYFMDCQKKNLIKKYLKLTDQTLFNVLIYVYNCVIKKENLLTLQASKVFHYWNKIGGYKFFLIYWRSTHHIEIVSASPLSWGVRLA